MSKNEKSIFTDFVGDSLRTRAIEYFVTWKDVRVSPSDLVDDGVGEIKEVKKEISFLLDEKFIKKNGLGYTLNNRNKVATTFYDLFKTIINQSIPKLEKKIK